MRLRETNCLRALSKDQKQWSWGSNLHASCHVHEPHWPGWWWRKKNPGPRFPTQEWAPQQPQNHVENACKLRIPSLLQKCFCLTLVGGVKSGTGWGKGCQMLSVQLCWADSHEGREAACAGLHKSPLGIKIPTAPRNRGSRTAYVPTKLGRVTSNDTENCDPFSSCADRCPGEQRGHGKERQQDNISYLLRRIYCMPGAL